MGKTKISHYKIRCRVRLDIVPGTTENYVEVSSTLVQKLLNLKTNRDPIFGKMLKNLSK